MIHKLLFLLFSFLFVLAIGLCMLHLFDIKLSMPWNRWDAHDMVSAALDENTVDPQSLPSDAPVPDTSKAISGPERSNTSQISRGSSHPSGSETSSSTQQPANTSKIIAPAYKARGKWQLIWHDDFSRFDLKKWNAIESSVNYNDELQAYSPKNVRVKDGFLYLQAKKVEVDQHPYTSAKITTQNKFVMQYGKISVRLKHPIGKGLFPAVWLLPDKGDVLPEIDIFEAIGSEPHTVYYVNHWTEYNAQKRSYTSFKIENLNVFHTYTVEWRPDCIIWSVDNRVRFISKKGIPKEPMFLIINLAVGGVWPGAPNHDTRFPSSLIIDDLKIYQKM